MPYQKMKRVSNIYMEVYESIDILYIYLYLYI